MTLGVKRPPRIDKFIAEWFALVFSVIVAFLGPRYATWYGDAIPNLIRLYFAYWPVWIAINALSLIVRSPTKKPGQSKAEYNFWRRLDGMLSALAFLTVIAGVVSLVVPAMHMRTF